MEIPKKYNFEDEQAKWKEFWQKEKLYVYAPDEREDYVVDTPPPTVSGKMHLGHAFSYTQQDIVARYKRQKGLNVCYPFGTDDNGLPTEKLVEKLKKVRSTKMERKAFIDLCNETIKQIKPDFISDWISIGMSCDFDGSYSTIDPHSMKTSQAAFIDLFEKGMVKQEESPVIWDTQFQTAVAQAELESVDMKSHFNDIVFKAGANGRDLIIATTRPELLPSCVAVIAHPDDERYKDLIGKTARPPLMDFDVPIIADARADPEKGTGIVMCCTFGDKTDIEWWREFKLPLRVSIGRDGKMTELAGKYSGLPVKDARAEIITDLKDAGLLAGQKEIMHAVNTYEKSGREVEFLNTKQWFVKILERKQELIDAADRIKWYPKFMKKRYIHWVKNLNWDWCISRQRHFGVPFPVWYEKDTGKIVLASKDQLPVDPTVDVPANYSGDVSNLIAETDVMDTWATSSCTPQIICNAYSDGGYATSMKQFPNAMRPQAHDIIRTWAFYTIVKGLYLFDDIPWKDIVISGHVLDPRGNKMSKSKGNVIDPRDVLSKYGADVLRFWAGSSKLGDDLAFQEKELVTAKKTVTKLWNACKFASMHLEDYDGCVDLSVSEMEELRPIDHWILSHLNQAVAKATAAFDDYEYSIARHAIDGFFWRVLCDNYLEIVKDRLYKPEVYGDPSRRAAQYVLRTVFSSVIRLYAPFMPFITESCYQYFFKEDASSVHVALWPGYISLADDQFTVSGDVAVDVIGLIRKAKSGSGDALNAEISVLRIPSSFSEKVSAFLVDIKSVAKADSVEFVSGDEVSYDKK